MGENWRAFVGSNGKVEVEEISGIREVGLHSGGEVQLCQICNARRRPVNNLTSRKARNNDGSCH
jgi:hypothetical protein